MKRTNLVNSRAQRALRVLACAAVLTVVACDNDVNFNATRPTLPFAPTGTDSLAGPRSLQIVGNLTAERGSCLEATVLYDGKELDGARTTCSQDTGCTKLRLSAVVQSDPGRHTVSFRVLRQSPEAVTYSAGGSVHVTREGVPTLSLTMPLGPTRTSLRAGESVTFDVEFWNWN